MNNNIQFNNELNFLNEEEFMKLWNQNTKNINAFIMNKLVGNNLADAEDLFQNTFEKAWRNIHLFKK